MKQAFSRRSGARLASIYYHRTIDSVVRNLEISGEVANRLAEHFSAHSEDQVQLQILAWSYRTKCSGNSNPELQE